jgi:hypothetical protein
MYETNRPTEKNCMTRNEDKRYFDQEMLENKYVYSQEQARNFNVEEEKLKV